MVSNREALQNNTELLVLRSIVSTVQDGVFCFVSKADQRLIVYANETFERLTGYSAEDLQEKDAGTFFTDFFEKSEQMQIERIIELKACYQGGVKLYPYQGLHLWVKFTLAPVDLGDEDHFYYIGILKREYQQEKLLEKLRDSFDSKIMGMVIVDENLRMLETNDQFLNILGYDRNDPAVREMTWRKLSLLPPEEIDEMGEILRSQSSEIGMIKPLTTQLLNKNGQPVEVILTGAQLHLSEPRSIVFVIDNSRQKKIEHELENRLRKENLIRHIVELLNRSDALEEICNETVRMLGEYLQVDRCILRPFRFVNERAGRESVYNQIDLTQFVAQYTSGEDIEKIRIEDFPVQSFRYSENPYHLKTIVIEYEDSSQWKEYFRLLVEKYQFEFNHEPLERLFQKIDVYQKKYQIRALLKMDITYHDLPYGDLFLHQCNSKRLWTQDDIHLLETICFNLGGALYHMRLFQREQRARQEAETAKIQKEEFLANMSHELKTLLNAIIGYADMLNNMFSTSMELVGGKEQKYCQNISAAGQRLNRIMNHILSVIDIDSGRVNLQLQPIDIEAFSGQLLNQVRGEADKKNIEIELFIEPGLSYLEADEESLGLALLSLLENAIKFNVPNGRVTLRFRMSEDGGFVICEIEDTGIGISDEKLADVFSLFYQADGTRTRAYEGAGLGLYLAKRRIELCGGTIQIRSCIGQGTMITVTLPKTGGGGTSSPYIGVGAQDKDFAN